MNLELDDIQGLVRRGYGDMRHASFLLLRFEGREGGRSWLRGVVGSITDSSDEKPPGGRVNVAFTFPGLVRLGTEPRVLGAFSPEFREGMAVEHRRRILGDHGRSHPSRWDWGGPTREPVDAILLLYAPTAERLGEVVSAHRARLTAGVRELGLLETTHPADGREHFGFRDGIAQPGIVGLGPGSPPGNVVAAGEFVLGYPNETGRFAEGPAGFGRNGSYMVVRQMAQKVRELWTFLDAVTRMPDGRPDPDARVRLAAKMVGRWPSGAPLALHPDRDPDRGKTGRALPSAAENDAFGYAELDGLGDRCPIGAHIRRANPRDSLTPGPRISARNTARHRILRRGRAYGPPVAGFPDPEALLGDSPADDAERGLHFVCLNADIARQFELVQQSWIGSPKFEGVLYRDADPIVGVHRPGKEDRTNTFTIQGPLRQRVVGVPGFVEVRGGAYFFLPGIRALVHLAELG